MNEDSSMQDTRAECKSDITGKSNKVHVIHAIIDTGISYIKEHKGE